MLSFKQGLKVLIKKLQFNPVALGGDTIFTTTIGVALGAIVMVIVIIYAVGKFSVIYDPPNVVSNTFLYQNDPYEVNLDDWAPRISIYEKISKKYIAAEELFEMGLNITAWNIQGEDLNKLNPSNPIPYSSDPATMTIDITKTPFKVSGSSYVHQSPQIKQYSIQIKFCQPDISPKCSNNTNRIYQITLFLKPKWVYLDNPRQAAIRQMDFNQKVLIDRTKNTYKTQFIYDIYGFNVTSDASLLPDFFPRTVNNQNGSSMAGPASKIYLPQQAENVVQFHFRRAEKSEAFSRKYNSIDVIFADVLGVVALFGLILWVLFAHYSSWGSQQFILNSITGQSRQISLFFYLKFYLSCKKRSLKQQKILKQVHNDIISSFKQRKRRKIDIQIIKLQLKTIENALNLSQNEQNCKKQILQKLEEEENKQVFSSLVLTEEIRASLLTS